MTYGERRKRADIQLIVNDFDRLESAFLAGAQRLNKKRQAQVMTRVGKVLGELIEAHKKGDKEEVEGILATLKMPSSKEWYKLIEKLVVTSVESGILRSHFELLRLRELYEFDEFDSITGEYDYDVILPDEARQFLKKYAYEIGVITEEAVLERIKKALMRGLEEGLPTAEVTQLVKETAETWLSDWHAQTIARTESGKMYNAGRLTRWLDPENNGFVEALQYEAIIDSRTTELCRHLDGRIVAITNTAAILEYTPPNHFQCRATWIPVTKYEEWKDDFDTSMKPEKNFTYTVPLPRLLQGKKEPLVQPKKRIDPTKVTDPDEIRSLNDDDFKVAIKNVKDTSLKLSLVKERAESMLVRQTKLNEKKLSPDVTWLGFDSDRMLGSIKLYNKTVTFFMTQEIKDDVEKLVEQLKKASDSEVSTIIDDFIKKYAGSLAHMDLIRALREIQRVAPVEADWGGLDTVTQTAVATQLLTIKTPPNTKNYREATSLQQAIKDAQAWIKKYIASELAPKTGIRVKFEHDLRREYAMGGKGIIALGKYTSDPSVVIHEIGHVLHWNSPEVVQLIDEFYKQRTEGKSKEKLHGEDVIPDNFFNAYVGRLYGWEEKYKNHGQEVFSMGLQAMYSDPMEFYRLDKEHFLLTYAIMRGLF